MTSDTLPPTGALQDLLREAAQPMYGYSVDEEAHRLRGTLSKAVDCLSQRMHYIVETVQDETSDGPNGVVDLEVDGSDMTEQRRQENEESKLRVDRAREILDRQREAALGEGGDNTKAAPLEGVAATLLLLGCLRDVAEARRDLIFPPNSHYMSPEQRMVLDFLDSTCIVQRENRKMSGGSPNQGEGAMLQAASN